MSNNETAFSNGVEPSFKRSNIAMVKFDLRTEADADLEQCKPFAYPNASAEPLLIIHPSIGAFSSLILDFCNLRLMLWHVVLSRARDETLAQHLN